MKEPIIAEEVAENELESWFDFRKTKPNQRNNPNALTGVDISRKKLIESIMYGVISFDPKTGELTQKLVWPLKKDDAPYLSELKYKPRLTRLDVMNAGKGLKATDVEGKQAAYLAAATGTSIGVLNKMDEDDRGIADTIAGYFFQ